jgi:SAM-dependent methyltransferase
MTNYKEGAMKFYDIFGEKDDLDFYLDQAMNPGNIALEIGVGTGRLAIELARAGIETWGLELSPYMLKTAEKKIKKEPFDVQKRLHLIQGNAVNFSLEQRFDLIYFPSCSFDHILDPNDQQKALINFKNHLKPGGSFVFDLYLLKDHKVKKDWFVQKKMIGANRLIVRSGYKIVMPEMRQMSVDLWYEVVENGRITERYFEASKVYLHKTPEVRNLLSETGFKIVNEYGNHQGKEYEESDEMIVFVTKIL